MTDQELKIKCLEIATQRKAFDVIEEAERYYNFITNRELSSRPKLGSAND